MWSKTLQGNLTVKSNNGGGGSGIRIGKLGTFFFFFGGGGNVYIGCMTMVMV